jgi:hypothetical protein
VEEHKGKRPRCRQQDNIKTDIQETGCERVDWMNLAQDRFKWRALENTAMTLRVPENASNLRAHVRRIRVQIGAAFLHKLPITGFYTITP